MISEVNDIRFISILALSLIIVLVIASIKYETAFMYILMILLAVSMVNFLIGSIMPSNLDKISKGIIGFSKFALSQNLKPKLKFGLSVGQIFGIFFPAMTGVLAGVNISGNLRDPNKAIPRGTIAALLISTLIYLLTALIFVTSTLPATQGTIHEIFEIPANISLSQCAHSLDLPKITLICPNITNGTVDGNDVFISARNLSTPLNTTENHSNGLLYDYNIMKSISAYGPLTYAGLFAATLSSASAAFVAAPKIFQALCRDDLLPTMFRFFAVGHPQTDEPQRGYILCFIVIASLNLVGYLNRLAIFVAECTLFCYVLINYACSEMCSSKSLGWRPKFRWYNKYLSKITLVVIVAAMFVIEWRYAIFTYGVVGALFLYAKHRKLENNWGSPRQAHLYTKGLSCIQKFVNLDLHVKNFRPQCLVLTGYPSERPHLLHLIKQITGSHNLAIAGHVIWRNKRSLTLRIRENRSAQQWLRDNNYKLFYSQIQAKSLREGVSAMMQCSGVGQFRPNILVIGFKNAYRNLDIIDETLDYFEIIHDAFDLSMNVMIVRFQSKIQASGDLGCVTDEQAQEDEHLSSPSSIRIKTTQKEFTIRYEIDGKSNDLTSSKHVDNNANLTKTSLHSILHNKRCNEFVGIYLKRMKEETRLRLQLKLPYKNVTRKKADSTSTSKYKWRKFSSLLNPDGITNSPLLNLTRSHAGYIDIWWLYDDGGLSALIPYLLSQNIKWSLCRLRVYGIVDQDADMNTYRGMAGLLNLMRIKYDSVTIIDKFDKEEDDQTVERFMKRISDFTISVNNENGQEKWKLSQDDLFRNQSKTLRHARLSNLLKKHSADADVVFVTMMVPRKGSIPSLLYLSWLDLVSESHDAVCFIRGNQENVLTHYT
ncbi:hypothetical protein ACOME3_007087 [Neoechinorhynchus agilis]